MARTATTRTSRTAKRAVRKPSTAKRSSGGLDLLELFTDQLKDIYWAEKHLVQKLPVLQRAAASEVLKNAIEEHIAQTKDQVARLEEVFSLLDKKPQAKKCDAMEGLTTEAKTVISETEAGTATRDVGIIMSAQKVEHYEIAAYGSLTQLAKTIGLDEVADILAQTLAEEKDTDVLLTQIAESHINYEAAIERSSEGEEERVENE
jgi:ferritin-like metal-binding protein YciE